MSFTSKHGCPMCGIVAQAQRQRGDPNSPVPLAPPSASQPDVLWRDDNFTIYREKTNPVSSKGHLIVAFKSVAVSLHAFFVLVLTIDPSVCTYRPFTCSCVNQAPLIN
jgi:hypothetical protein